MTDARSRLTYRDAGVDIEAGDALVERIKPSVRATMRPEVLGGIGGFGALVEVSKKYKEPVMVSGTDGVGTVIQYDNCDGFNPGTGGGQVVLAFDQQRSLLPNLVQLLSHLEVVPGRPQPSVHTL